MARQPRSLRGAINAFCRWCIFDPKPGEGTCAEQIRRCTATTCPLYLVRPGAKQARRTPSQPQQGETAGQHPADVGEAKGG